ncbi:MAG: helix-turn-helix transcriptional regulator [Pseudomonadota bacterium]|nr:MAG: hypothetical protein DIU62_04510 [Pseudomonadota bacterium]
MTKTILVSGDSSLSTTASALPEGMTRSFQPVAETRGARVVVLEPVTVDAPLPADFVDIDHLVEQEEQDEAVRQAIAGARRQIAEDYYQDGERPLSWYRLQKGWSQKELATRLGTSQSYIARLEAGSIDPQVSTLHRLAEVLDVPPESLLHVLSKGVRRS